MAPKNRRRGRGGKSERQSGEKAAAAKADPAKDPPAAATKPADDAPSPAEPAPLKQLADVQNLSGNGPGSRDPDVMSMQVECASTVAPSEIEEHDETNEAEIEALAEELSIAQGAAEDVVAEETAAVDVSELLGRADAALASGREALASASPAPCDGKAPATDRLHWLLTRQHASPFEGQAFSPARVAEAAVDAAGTAAVPPITAEADVIASDETDAISAAEIVASLEARGAAAAAAMAEREEEITPERLAAAALGKLRPAAAQHVFDACSAAQLEAVVEALDGHVTAVTAALATKTEPQPPKPASFTAAVHAPGQAQAGQVQAVAQVVADQAVAAVAAAADRAHIVAGQAQAAAAAAAEQVHLAAGRTQAVAGGMARKAAAAVGAADGAGMALMVGAAAVVGVALFALARARRH